ncbi:SDR family oxidoreductase [Agromyces seonyuensis]|uniref:NAD(P)H-binding protein n=1 Tax=Agromyces seonyuensis TaxID=2662446 RepID=A0A6I4P8D2_9MICO|nr:SDR family oxidoreductase [Agromyces seonyuensis]MWC00295.1 NAD(P)H-binding protein [Agromyces seonyuensis]
MTLPTIGVTGATGAVGGMVVELLSAAGVPQRVLARSPERAPSPEGAVVLPCEYVDDPMTRKVLEGVETLLMVSAAETADRIARQAAFIDAAAAAGVRHVVYTSFLGASPTARFTLARDHAATEAHLLASGMVTTFLRDNLYLDFLPRMIGEDGAIRGPAADGRVAGVARSDVARVAATVLEHPEQHVGAVYDLTGPAALSLAEVAAILAERLDRPVRYVPETIDEAYASRESYGAPGWQLDAWVSTYTAIAAGDFARVSDDVRRVTGRAPRSFADVLAAL